ncbi:MAG: tyrosine-type recombinase/integrase [Sedimentisphaeraceae bacterium JB056]
MSTHNWVLQRDKFLNKQQASRLLSVVTRRAKSNASKTATRDRFIIHLALSTGLRVMEISQLKCGDLFLDEKLCSVLVRSGKGSKKRQVFFVGPFRKHCRDFLKWKQQNGESIDNDAPLLISSNTGWNMTTISHYLSVRKSERELARQVSDEVFGKLTNF